MTRKIILYFLIEIIYIIFRILYVSKIIYLNHFYIQIIAYLKDIIQYIILILVVFDIKAFILKNALFDKTLENTQEVN